MVVSSVSGGKVCDYMWSCVLCLGVRSVITCGRVSGGKVCDYMWSCIWG